MTNNRTIAHLAHDQMRKNASRVLSKYPANGGWASQTWAEADTVYTEIAAGLWQLGVRKGDRVALLCETRNEWLSCDLAILSFGAVTVGLYPTLVPDQIAYIVQHSGSRVVIAEDAKQLVKIEEIRKDIPTLEHVVVIDAPERSSVQEWTSLEQLRDRGRALLAEQPNWAAKQRAQVEPQDTASIVYTSGTTGPPKGTVMTHYNFYEIALRSAEATDLSDEDVGVVILPLAHSFQRVTVYAGMAAGATAYFAEAIDKLTETCSVAQPTVMAAVPRLFEKVHAGIMARLAQEKPRRQRLFASAMRAGRQASHCRLEGRKMPLGLRLRFAYYERLVFSRIRARLFGPRLRCLVSGGAPLSKEIAEFFHALGISILEGYGLTETSAPATVNRLESIRFGTVGTTLPDVEVKIASDGEILIRGPGNFREYYRDPAATREAFDEDGFFKTGDIGELDGDGYLRITDRKKDIIVTAGGKNIAPQNIEALIKNDPRIGQAVVFGDRKPYLVALITLDPDEAAPWAERLGVDVESLAGAPEVQQAISSVVEGANSRLARYETVKKWRLLENDFTVENGMLTPTLKPKRKAIVERYQHELQALYE